MLTRRSRSSKLRWPRGRGPIPSGERSRWPTTPQPGSASARSCGRARWTTTAGCSQKHIAPHLGGVPLGKLSTPMIRQWRATLLGNGVSVSVAAKAYRLLRAVLMTATEDDKILTRNPCRIRGAGDEETAERPVLTVAQVFELAERVGRRPAREHPQAPGGRLPAPLPAARGDADGPRGLRHDRQEAEAVTLEDGRRRPGRLATPIAGSAPWSCWPRSPASAGAK